MQLATTATQQHDGSIAGWLAPLALFAAACLLYSINLGRMAHPDEFHHILAAQGLLATGEPRIAEGVYTRVYLQTWLVAKSFSLFGDSLAAARVPSLIATALLVATLFLRGCGAKPAWRHGSAPSSSAPRLSRSTWRSSAASTPCRAWRCSSPRWSSTRPSLAPSDPPWRRLALLVLALAPLMLAVYLQPTSLLGSLGLGLWAVVAIGLPWLADPGVPRTRKLAMLGGLVLAATVAAALAVATGVAADLAPVQLDTVVQSAWQRSVLVLPWLVQPALSHLVAGDGVARPVRHRRPIHGGKHGARRVRRGLPPQFLRSVRSLRYIAYAQPFLFVVWGIALAALWPHLLGFVRMVQARLLGGVEVGGKAWMADVLLAGALGFLLLANAATIRTVALLADVTVPPEQPRTNWPAAREALEPWLKRADIVVTTEELGHLYFLGRYDVRFSPSKLGELGDMEQREFGLDHRTGRPVIGTRNRWSGSSTAIRPGSSSGPRHTGDSPSLSMATSQR